MKRVKVNLTEKAAHNRLGPHIGPNYRIVEWLSRDFIPQKCSASLSSQTDGFNSNEYK